LATMQFAKRVEVEAGNLTTSATMRPEVEAARFAGTPRRRRRAAALVAMVGKVTVTVPTETPVDDVVDVVSRLIRFDTTNTGDLQTTKGEAECARWFPDRREGVGTQVKSLGSGARGRGNVFARLK